MARDTLIRLDIRQQHVCTCMLETVGISRLERVRGAAEEHLQHDGGDAPEANHVHASLEPDLRPNRFMSPLASQPHSPVRISIRILKHM